MARTSAFTPKPEVLLKNTNRLRVFASTHASAMMQAYGTSPPPRPGASTENPIRLMLGSASSACSTMRKRSAANPNPHASKGLPMLEYGGMAGWSAARVSGASSGNFRPRSVPRSAISAASPPDSVTMTLPPVGKAAESLDRSTAVSSISSRSRTRRMFSALK